MQFTVGHKSEARTEHVVVEAHDALSAALQVKARFPNANIMYVRPTNKRGDARHPVGGLAGAFVAHG